MRPLGMGKPSSRRLQRYSSMASRMFANASASVSPWLAHPGRLGTYTENPPADSCSRMTLYRWTLMAISSLRDGVRFVKESCNAGVKQRTVSAQEGRARNDGCPVFVQGGIDDDES